MNETAATQDLLAALVGQAGTLLDAGVNVGRYSWFMARHRRAGVPLYGFDPNADAFALARRNLAGLPDITLLPIGLAAQDEEATLAVPQDATGNPISGLGFVLGGNPPPTGSAIHSITLKSLDGLISDGMVRLVSPVLLKMDIEGYEPAASREWRRFWPATAPGFSLNASLSIYSARGTTGRTCLRRFTRWGISFLPKLGVGSSPFTNRLTAR
ncbi:hypothetical protein VZ95_11975 [Elstera litoralis]|uniref:Methyltransferase FkbM domain-containing protein n=1 Tax=Elstera litoralis TaxID=552518 RepID=A0A0F3IRI3_9PROT|nr:FkbM family methyltransferase [Elstera litoralis]KJV09365.1 hypothetical protein VZ95_11975 [Elstera litoralis]